MKLVIAGSRDIFPTTDEINEYVGKTAGTYGVLEVVCGMAKGVDLAGRTWASRTGRAIREMPAEWDTYGKRAGPIRNAKMAAYGDALLLIWDGSSRGSKNMKEEMLKLGKPVYEIIRRSNVAR